jgi:bifunctional UDP-N-acetylglucosamine pyrophosphorylase/glucosamine-1-phosphate N-acetyltransferase
VPPSAVPPAAVVVLAAGEGTRMRSALPKVLHPVCGRSLLGHVLDAVAPLGAAHTLVVVGHGRDAVTAALPPGVTAVVQEEQRGTGHAVRVALDAVPDLDGTVVVTYGDMPLLPTATLERLVAAHDGGATVLTARFAEPYGYGRIVRDADGYVAAIVEERDATDEQRAIDEVNGGVYAFDAAALRGALAKLSTDNAQGEEYLTDVVALIGRAKPVVGTEEELAGVNDRAQLAAVAAVLRDRVLAGLMASGVTVVDPATTWVDATVTVEPDVTIEPFTRLRGTTRVETGAVVGPHAEVVDAVVGPGATVGPFAYLRPGTVLGPKAKAGTYVEIKASTIGAGSKVPHLSYVGDATVGERTNIGAATVVVNYDGREKHKTVIGDDVRIGSDTMLVAPVEVGDGAYTAAGSVITRDVPPGALGVGRAYQRNVEGWVARRRGATTAEGAEQ